MSHPSISREGAWASELLLGCPLVSLWTKPPPDLPRAGGDPSWSPRLGVGWGGSCVGLLGHVSSSKAHVSTPPSRGLLPNGIGQTPFPSVVCRTQSERGREGDHGGGWGLALTEPSQNRLVGAWGQGVEGAEPPHSFPPHSWEPQEAQACLCGPGIGGGGGSGAKGASSGAQAEMGEEDRLRGLQALLASPCLRSSFPCSQGFPVSPCPSHLCPPLPPRSWLLPVLDSYAPVGGPSLYLPPLPSPQGLSTGLLAHYSLPGGVCFRLVTVTWSVTGPPTWCDVRTTKKATCLQTSLSTAIKTLPLEQHSLE